MLKDCYHTDDYSVCFVICLLSSVNWILYFVFNQIVNFAGICEINT